MWSVWNVEKPSKPAFKTIAKIAFFFASFTSTSVKNGLTSLTLGGYSLISLDPPPYDPAIQESKRAATKCIAYPIGLLLYKYYNIKRH